jgi:hypothetical protein
MRKTLVLAGLFAACTALAACNPSVKDVSAPCNCHGSVATADSGAENQRFVPPPGGGDDQGATTDQGSSGYGNGGSYREHRGHGSRYRASYRSRYRGHYSEYSDSYSERSRPRYHHGYTGTDEQYAAYWSAARVATSSYDYRSTSRVTSTGGGSYSGGGYYSGGDSYHGGGYGGGGGYASGGDDSWQDGYGRTHRGTRLTRGEYKARMDPWHGYDADCYDRDHRHHRRHY